MVHFSILTDKAMRAIDKSCLSWYTFFESAPRTLKFGADFYPENGRFCRPFLRTLPVTFWVALRTSMSPRNRVTLSEIAEQSGVSLPTVSLVLRDKPGVGTATRQCVLGIAKKLGYLPKNGIQNRPSLTNAGLILKSEPSRTPQTNQFYSHVLADIEMACRLELPLVLLEEDTVDGLLLIGAFLDNTIARVVEMDMPAVQLLVNCVEYPASSPVTTVIHPHLGERQSVQSI
jgi:hypothetical protein